MARIPNYARSADYTRLVKILCRGICSQERYAEMNVPFPGREILQKPEVGTGTGTFIAKCLKCGYEAHDCHNWEQA